MSEDYTSFEEKRRHLIADIARQRGELAQAYRNLEQPIHYAEYGMRGFGFLRKNSWVFVAVPAVLKIAATLISLSRGKGIAPPPARKRTRPHLEEDEKPPKGLLGHAIRWGGHGFRLFKVYRRVRRYFS